MPLLEFWRVVYLICKTWVGFNLKVGLVAKESGQKMGDCEF